MREEVAPIGQLEHKSYYIEESIIRFLLKNWHKGQNALFQAKDRQECLLYIPPSI